MIFDMLYFLTICLIFQLTITTEDKELLFGENFEFEQAFRDIDKDTNGKVWICSSLFIHYEKEVSKMFCI